MTLGEIISTCASDPEFVANQERLTSGRLGQFQRRSGIEMLVDHAAGFEPEVTQAFVHFVLEYVVYRMRPD